MKIEFGSFHNDRVSGIITSLQNKMMKQIKNEWNVFAHCKL